MLEQSRDGPRGTSRGPEADDRRRVAAADNNACSIPLEFRTFSSEAPDPEFKSRVQVPSLIHAS